MEKDGDEAGPRNDGSTKDVLVGPAEMKGRLAPTPTLSSHSDKCPGSARGEVQAFVKIEGREKQIEGLRVGHP